MQLQLRGSGPYRCNGFAWGKHILHLLSVIHHNGHGQGASVPRSSAVAHSVLYVVWWLVVGNEWIEIHTGTLVWWLPHSLSALERI